MAGARTSRTSAIAVLLALLSLVSALEANPHSRKHQHSWKQHSKPVRREEKFVTLNFFLHDNLLVPNASAFFIVPPLDGNIPVEFVGNSFFGGVVAIDDSVTVGADPASLEIGRAKGVYIWDTNNDASPSTELVITVVWNEAAGFAPRSSLSLRGYNPITSTVAEAAPVRESAVVGGTGEFRLARGWVDYQLLSVSGFNYAAIVNYTAYVYYGGF